MAAVAVVASTTALRAEWTKIRPGPTYDVAEAQCALMAMGAQRGHLAIGSPAFVAGATIGAAIGGAIRTSIIKQKCMTINGWKNVREGALPGENSAEVERTVHRRREHQAGEPLIELRPVGRASAILHRVPCPRVRTRLSPGPNSPLTKWGVATEA